MARHRGYRDGKTWVPGTSQDKPGHDGRAEHDEQGRA